MVSRLPLISLLLSAAIGFSLWYGLGFTPPQVPDNIILITLDTTRADALGIYGNRQAKTPVLDQLARQGHYFTECYAPAPITLPAHTSLMTGVIPPRHGVRNNGSYRLTEQETLAKLLGARGFATGAFVGSVILQRQYGLDQGFDHYDDQIVHYREDSEKSHIVTRRAETVVQRAWDWISNRKKPFFAWLHLYDAHWPYEPPSPFREAYADLPYLGEIAYMDLQIGWLIHQLRQQNLWQNTLLVVTADHGESFGEHQEQTHGYFVYDSTTHVPLIVSHPLAGLKGAKQSHMVQSLDIMPTILDLYGIESTRRLDGIPLTSDEKRTVYAEATIPHEHYYCAPVQSLKNENYSLYVGNEVELYDRRSDPLEAQDLAQKQPHIVRELLRGLPDYRSEHDVAAALPMDPSTVELLRSLGYVHDGGSYVPRSPDPHQMPNPKKHLPVFLQAGEARRRQDRFPFKAIEAYSELVTRFPDNIFLNKELGRLLTHAGERELSLRYLRSAAEQAPYDPRLHTLLGNNYQHFGEWDLALDEYRLALELDEHHLIARYNAGLVFLQQGQWDLARQNFEAVLAQRPHEVYTLNNLAVLTMRESGNREQAIAYLERAKERYASHPLILRNLHRLTEGEGRD